MTSSAKVRIRTLLGGEPDAIFILSGGVVTKMVGGRPMIRSTSYADHDQHGLVVGGKARVIAAAEIARHFPTTVLVTTSFPPRDPASNARVMARELHHLGVPSERVVCEERSISTLTELIEMVKLAAANQWNHLVVLTNAYHLPRVRELYRRLPILVADDPCFRSAWSFPGREYRVVSCEAILRVRSPHYARLIVRARETEGYRARVKAEARGVRQLRAGTYGKPEPSGFP